MKEYFLYKLTFPNDKVYIGQTVNFHVRMTCHKNDSFNINRRSRNCQVNNAIRKYGWENISKEVILTCDSSVIDYAEIKYIKLYKANDRKFGYNREGGGNSRKIVSKESRKLISVSRISKKQWSKPILQIDSKSNKVIKEWESISLAARTLNIPASNISYVCNNKIKKCVIRGKEYYSFMKMVGGFKWKFNKALTIA